MKEADESRMRTVATCTVAENGDRPIVTYVLLSERIEGECGGNAYTLICKSGDGEAVMRDIARNERTALEIFSTFVRNTVTPVGCFDVIEELI